jgi:hypothetical protein
MITLHVCFGMFLAICGSVRDYDYANMDECMKARQQIISQVGDGYAICMPKELNKAPK